MINFTNTFEMPAVKIIHRLVNKIKKWCRINLSFLSGTLRFIKALAKMSLSTCGKWIMLKKNIIIVHLHL